MRKLSFLLWLCLCVVARGEWAVTSAASEFSANRLVEHRHVVVGSGARDTTLDLALFATKAATFRVIDNGRGAADLATAMRASNCIAGVNGGYFDPQFAPLGLRIVDRKMTSPLIRARLLTGVLLASQDRGVEIVRVSEFSGKRKLTAAVECGPLLVDSGVSVRGLNDARSARRTFAAVTKSGRAALGYCDEATLAELGAILASGTIEGFATSRALNLDGGSSSAFWFQRADGSTVSIGELKNVRDFVGVVAK